MLSWILIALLHTQVPASAPADDPAVTFRRALFDFNQGDYRSVVDKLSTLLVAHANKLSEDDVAEARKVLGTVHFLLGDKAKARSQFQLLVLTRPSSELDPYSTAPPVLRFFAEVKNDELKAAAAEMQRVFDVRRERFEAPRYIERRAIMHHELLAFLPFGIGQFQNDDVGLGIMFLAFDLVALAANVAGYVTLQLSATPQGVLLDDADGRGARTRTTWLAVQYSGLGAFFAGWIAGAIHARLFFQPIVFVDKELPATGSKPALSLGLQTAIRF